MAETLSPTNAPAGTRCLIQRRHGYTGLCEVTVLEWSPSGTYVKVHHSTQPPGGHSWINEDDLAWTELLEVLPPIVTPSPPAAPAPGSSADITDPHARF